MQTPQSFQVIRLAGSVTQIAVCSYFGKPHRQYILFKTADKFSSVKRDFLQTSIS